MQDKQKLPREKSLQSGTATIKDLAPEEKEKIGELMRRLANQKALRQEYQSKYEELKVQYDQLSVRYERDVTNKDDENRLIRLELKNSLRKLEQSTEHLKLKKGVSKLPNETAVVTPKLHDVESQPNLKQLPQRNEVSPLKGNTRSSSKRQEIEELKKQIQTLSKGIKSMPSTTVEQTLATCSPEPVKRHPLERPTQDPKAEVERLRQYQLIKSRYTTINNLSLVADDSFRAAPEQPETPTLPDPMTFLKTEPEKQQPAVETSAFLEHSKQSIKPVAIDHYQTQRVASSSSRYDGYSIVQTVKKGTESRTVTPNTFSSAYRSGFYGSQLLDLVEFLDK